MSTFLPSLKKQGHLDCLHMTLCNVGSRKLEQLDDHASQGWQIFAPHLTIYGFDADLDACEAANADLADRQINWTEQHIPLALAKTDGESTLYVTRHPMCSSLYPPNESFLARFDQISAAMDLDFTIEVETTTLDAFCAQRAVETVDFLKIDVQGADLEVLQGAEKLLKESVLAIQVEVEPSPLYINQPLFSDVDAYLREQDYTLFDIQFSRRIRKKSPIFSPAHPGQILWGDGYYFYDFLRDDISLSRPKTPEQLFKLACVADVMNFSDYALEILEYLTLNHGSQPEYNFADAIIETLAGFPELVEDHLGTLAVVASIRDWASPDTTQLLD
jgi:FkbM family methyltransferase